jgi:hypothetical protein
MLPNFPTDSLYKFMCFAGITLVFACGIFYKTQEFKIQGRLDEMQMELAADSAEAYINDEHLSQLEVLQKKLEEKLDTTKSLSPFDAQQHLRSLDSSKLLLQSVEKAQILANSKSYAFNAKLRMISRDSDYLENLGKPYNILLWVGGILFVTSLFLWWAQIQYPSDEKIKLELELLRKQVAQGRQSQPITDLE